jgi:YVTN family beta-propeller protein
LLAAAFIFIFAFIFAASPILSAQQPAAPAPPPKTPAQPYRVIARWKIDGDGGWDHLITDPDAHRLYIAHGNEVDVVDTNTGKSIGTIPNLHGVHSIALDTAGKFGYITDGGANAVVAFDRSTLAVTATIPVGTGPDDILFEPVTQTVWAFNGRSHDVSVIAVPSSALIPPGSNTAVGNQPNTVIATIPLPGKPEFPVTDGQGTVFDNIEDKNEIVRIDARSKTITATWPTGCDSPSGLAYDAAGFRLFAACDGKKASVIDTTSGKLLANPSIGDGPDGAGFTDAHSLAFVSSRDGILSVIDAAATGYPTIESLTTEAGARTMTYDSTTDRIYLITADLGTRPDPTPQNPRPRPPVIPGTFTVIVVGR